MPYAWGIMKPICDVTAQLRSKCHSLMNAVFFVRMSDLFGLRKTVKFNIHLSIIHNKPWVIIVSDTFHSYLWLHRFQRGNVRALGSLPAGVEHFPPLVGRRFADVSMPRLKKKKYIFFKKRNSTNWGKKKLQVLNPAHRPLQICYL